jgi:hypothetical protein
MTTKNTVRGAWDWAEAGDGDERAFWSLTLGDGIALYVGRAPRGGGWTFDIAGGIEQYSSKARWIRGRRATLALAQRDGLAAAERWIAGMTKRIARGRLTALTETP